MELRDPSKDYELYKQTCQDLQRLMAEIQELKSKGNKDSVRHPGLAGCGAGRVWSWKNSPDQMTRGEGSGWPRLE